MNKLIRQFALFGLISTSVFAEQFQIPNIFESEKRFWDHLYVKGGWTLFCGDRFDNREDIMLAAIYSMTWVSKHLGCKSISQCRSDKDQFNRIEADLHNYYPTLQLTGRARDDFSFGNIPGEFREYFECNFERDGKEKIIEPRPSARGNIARSLFYMHKEYNLPLNSDQVLLFKDWNLADPPSEDEIRRNSIIEELQGTRNLFIDKPELASQLVR